MNIETQIEDNYAGGHLIIDLLTNNVNTINNEQSIKDYLDLITDIVNLTAIIPPFVFKFPFSSEVKRLTEKLSKDPICCNSPIVQQAMSHLNTLQTRDCGVSGMVIFAESHASVHSWPQYKINNSDGGITIDIFSCNKLDYNKVLKFTNNYFKCNKLDAIYIDRYFGSPQVVKTITMGQLV